VGLVVLARAQILKGTHVFFISKTTRICELRVLYNGVWSMVDSILLVEVWFVVVDLERLMTVVAIPR
jgi:hypothetical protein